MRQKLTTIRYRLRLGLTILALLLFVIFLLQNTETIRVKFLIFEADVASAIVILVTSLLGFMGGFFAALNMQRLRRKHQNTEDR
jgi:uncharacterized integral membrane protein